MKLSKKELMKHTKEQLVRKILAMKGISTIYNTYFTDKQAQIYNYRRRLMKIRDSIDHILKHPYSQHVMKK